MNTRIDAAKLQALIQKHGLKMTAQSSFVRVDAENGTRIYVQKSPLVSRIDISGFVYPHPGVLEYDADKRPSGMVLQKVDFGQTEEAVLETVDNILEHMKSLPRREATKRQPKKDGEPVKGWSFEATTEATQPQA